MALTIARWFRKSLKQELCMAIERHAAAVVGGTTLNLAYQLRQVDDNVQTGSDQGYQQMRLALAVECLAQQSQCRANLT